MDHNELNYLHEQAREESEGFPLCRCSNCAPDEAKILKVQMKEMNLSNFDSILDQTLLPGQIPVEEPKNKTTRSRRPKPKKLSLLMQKLSSTLVSSFNKFFADVYGKPRLFLPQQIFGSTEANAIATNFDKVKNKSDIAKLIGGEALEGELDMLDVSIENFKQGDDYQAYLKELDDYEKFIGNEME
jgi:hypothetical protein